MLSVHYQQYARWRPLDRPVEIRLARKDRAIVRMYLSEDEARTLRGMLDALPESVLAELPEEIEPRALASWPRQATFK